MDIQSIVEEARETAFESENSLPVCYIELGDAEILQRFDAATTPDLKQQIGRFMLLGRELGKRHKELNLREVVLIETGRKGLELMPPLLGVLEEDTASHNVLLVEIWHEHERQGTVFGMDIQRDENGRVSGLGEPVFDLRARPSMRIDAACAGYDTRTVPDKEFLEILRQQMELLVERQIKSKLN